MIISHPNISIIIPTYNDVQRLEKCLSRLTNQQYSSENFEIIIVDNDNTTRGQLNMQLPENAKVYFEPKQGSYAARNTGLSHASGEIIAFTDSDCIPDEAWLSNAVQVFENHPEIQRVSGSIEIFREPQSSWLVAKFEAITAFNQSHNSKKGVGVTANLFVRKSVFDEVGSFNEALMSGGDIEWNQRAEFSGVSLLYCDDVKVYHPARKTLKSLVNKYRRVFGGGYQRAKESNSVFRLVLWHCIPPIRYGRVLLDDGKKTHEVIFACLIFWVMKVAMLGEIARLAVGGKPLR